MLLGPVPLLASPINPIGLVMGSLVVPFWACLIGFLNHKKELLLGLGLNPRAQKPGDPGKARPVPELAVAASAFSSFVKASGKKLAFPAPLIAFRVEGVFNRGFGPGRIFALI